MTIYGGAVLDIQTIEGGLLKVSASIKNIGESDAADINWNIALDGGVLILNGANSGTISSISTDDEVTISSNLILGFGKSRIVISAEIPGGSYDERQQTGNILLFFIKMVPGGG